MTENTQITVNEKQILNYESWGMNYVSSSTPSHVSIRQTSVKVTHFTLKQCILRCFAHTLSKFDHYGFVLHQFKYKTLFFTVWAITLPFGWALYIKHKNIYIKYFRIEYNIGNNILFANVIEVTYNIYSTNNNLIIIKYVYLYTHMYLHCINHYQSNDSVYVS